MNKKKVCCIIPALNEEKTIGRVISEVKKYVKNVIVIDDNSDDKTGEISKSKGARVIRHKNKEGYANSIGDGLRVALNAGFEIIVTIDADGQHEAKDVPPLIGDIEKGAGIAIGQRPYKARFAEYLFSLYSEKKIGISDPLCGLRAYSSNTLERISYVEKIYSVGTQVLFEAGKKGIIIEQEKISLNKRKDKPRFGNIIVANIKILYGMINMILKYGF